MDDPRYPIAKSYLRFDGDSATIAVDADVARSWLLGDFMLREIPIVLAEVNKAANEQHRLRLRVAVAHGETVVTPPFVGGDAVRRAARLRDATALRDAMTNTPDADLGLILADDFFSQVVKQGERGLSREAFKPVDVQVKDFTERGWIHMTTETRNETTQQISAMGAFAHLQKISENFNYVEYVNSDYVNFGVVNNRDDG
ncbi:hypothetical protein EV193_101682 [Herbihabitans rhizosphaerae]|uniref:Uncharacterized protein n=1 Tax=Herbihabitans rhizosphaerae TaxID=1872711 RepID=A0A4V2EUJ6_9PSEU|nr:hypothetical protein [Herbihabitans rhizosphaerae]RZS44803.1 hypothetical protein EV193_101682 [Herbihabitans rhizosphaerae]